MSWDFDELDMLEVSRSSEDISGTRDWLSAVEDGGGRDELERSRRRIQAASLEGWQKVLDLHEADPTSVRKAYHNLARLHHPDKSRSHADAEVFKMVHKAYVDGLAAVAKEAYTDKELVRAAVDEWEHDYDEGNANSVPDCIPEVEAAELASWLQAKKCVLLDCREAVEAKYERRATATQIPKSLRIGFGDLRALPHTLLKDLSQLKDNTCDIVTFSTHGGTSGNCGMCAALLIDVFGLDASRVWRLEGGLDAWFAWAAENPSTLRDLQ
ncbi:CIPK12 [Symbiodinium natans]|uniref:CIPK12 protein n=1 Tax=Symbiodinium natans TaxID=878477 RepID=A0A812UVI9_9DINO|nr:CIPK12 [Symbiodinium natans]